MGGYAIRVNRFLSLTLSLIISVTSPLLSFRYASGPTLYSALSHLHVRLAPLCPLSGWSPETANTDTPEKPHTCTIEKKLYTIYRKIWFFDNGGCTITSISGREKK